MDKKKRVTIKLKNPNPLFTQWLTEWRDEEKAKNSKKQYCYTNALQSLKKYPLPLSTGKDCIILQGFGEKLCQMLDSKLKSATNNGLIVSDELIIPQIVDPSSNNITKTQTNPKKPQTNTSNDDCTKTQKVKPKKPQTVDKPKTTYTPSYRSGGYAILIVLYQDSIDPTSKGFLTKNEIVEKGLHLCDKSFTKPDAGSYYTAWSTMSTLITKGFIKKEGNPPKFSLTDEGVLIGHKLYKSNLIETNTNSDLPDSSRLSVENVQQFNIEPSKKDVSGEKVVLAQVNPKGKKKIIDKFPSISSISSQTSSGVVVEDSFILGPNLFDVILLVDKQETAGAGKKAIEDETILELNHLQVKYEVRHLKVGDYAWICRDRETKKELVLPYVVERKRMDDFGSSIKDGRFHEQKFRLKQSGIPNLIYVVESYGSNKHTGLPLSTLYQAATNTLIQDEFSVKFTENLRGTMRYLASFSKIMINVFKSKTLMSCTKNDLVKTALDEDLIPLMTFWEFNQTSSKNKTLKVRDLFIKQLLQLKGVSVDKALGVVEVYPTPRALKAMYGECAGKQAENLLANVEFGKLKKKIGPTISKTIFQFFTARTY